MSKQDLEKALRKELTTLNYEIDRRIVKGLSYVREAKRHRFILSSLSGIGKSSRFGWFTRPKSFGTFSII